MEIKANRIVRFWRQVSRLGVEGPEDQDFSDRKVRTLGLTNQICVVLSAIFLLVVITDPLLLRRFDASTGRYLIGLITCMVCLLCNARRWYTASRLLLVVVIPFLFLAYPALRHNTNEVSLLWMPTGITLYSMLPYLIFRWPEERVPFIVSILILLGFCIFSDQLLRLGSDPAFPVLDVIERHYFPYKRSILALWLFLNLPMIYFMILVRRYENRLQASHTEIAEKQVQILDQNVELKAQQSQITAINQSLERKVQQRTEELKEQNDRLAEYAFINAHLLRAPLARIQGLVYLMELTEAMAHNELLFQYLQEAVEEFSEVVQQINHLIEEGDHFSRADFAKSTSLAPGKEPSRG